MLSIFGRLARLWLLIALLTAPLGAALVASAASSAAVAGQEQPVKSQAPSSDHSQGILNIPISQTTPELDGSCTEYAAGVSLPYDDVGGRGSGKVFLQVDSALNLYVCIEAAAGSVNSPDRFASLYLDPQADGNSYVFARKNDYSLRVGVPGAENPVSNGTFNGSGVANGYTRNTSLDGAWSGVSRVVDGAEIFEYEVALERLGVSFCQTFGIAAYHHWARSVGDDYGWPGSRYFDQPGTWRPAFIDHGDCATQSIGRIAYVYHGDTADAIAFHRLLTNRGYGVDLVPLSAVLSTDFRVYGLVIIADDTGDLDSWGTPPDTASQVAQIARSNVSIMGLGEGGYAFFGQLKLFIGWPNGWHRTATEVFQADGGMTSYFSSPTSFAGTDPIVAYSAPVNEVGIHLGERFELAPPDATVIGMEPPPGGQRPATHASLISQGCRSLWGFSGNPYEMTLDGRDLFINGVEYTGGWQCAPPPSEPPAECVSISKSASPPDGTPVQPGDVIEYTITYLFSQSELCKNEGARIVDVVPEHTFFVPGSAGAGVAPDASGALVWSIAPAAGEQKLTFKVQVSDTVCREQGRITNQARLSPYNHAAIDSNLVVHPVECPPITMPNDEPPYAQQEVSIHPYPLVTGHASAIEVVLTNSSGVSQTVKVSFQTSPNRFGIGLNFNTFDSQVVTIPAGGNILVSSSFTPVSSGHYCIQILIEGEGFAPIWTQRNLDVVEDLRPGVPDSLSFKVANPTDTTSDIRLVVINTCPDWTATVSPTVLTSVGPNSMDVRNATLEVTPPDPTVLGSGCHIDVQGWVGDQLIGGIRKLDVPPVHLPPEVNPPWLEPEISVIPNPPVVGEPAQICVELQNPLSESRDVELIFKVADFGAGVSFRPVAGISVTLPPNSIDRYCGDWVPEEGGTLHRCIQVELRQAGYHPMRSQLNIDLRRAVPSQVQELTIPLVLHNPDLTPHNLQLKPTLIGINPLYEPRIVLDSGDPLPSAIGPREALNAQLSLLLPASMLAETVMPAYDFGDESRIDVSVLFDNRESSGFTVQLETLRQYMPTTFRQ